VHAVACLGIRRQICIGGEKKAQRLKQLTCYQIYETAPRLVPGRSERAWMDATDRRFAYRCLPLLIANSMGWEIVASSRVIAEWNGESGLSDVVVNIDDRPTGDPLASSHFGHGILTFHTGYVFRTEPGVAIWARGAPNWLKDGIAPLEGVIETDWLPFTFTMNWQFTRPGRIVFEKDEPFCFITPIEYRALDRVEPEILSIDQDPEFREKFHTWRDARVDFNRRLREQDPDAVKQGWQKWYSRGEDPSGGSAPATHISKLRVAAPRFRKSAGEASDAPFAIRPSDLAKED
jgi:hypothetical protein